MAEETPTEGAVENNPTATPAEEGGIPKSRFNEVIGQKNELKKQVESMQAQLSQIAREKEEAEKAKRLKAGEAEVVIGELEQKLGQYEKQAQEFQKMQAQRLDTLRNKLPEDKRDKYAHITDMGLLESLVDDFTTTGGGAPTDRSSVPKEDFGGYGSFTEWANKDMKGFSEHMAKESEQAIKWGVVPE